ncbi:phosphotransferase enzyme family protein [Luteibacter yeojuensis]|uniref:Aminoglycoside phosphotransferase n=1 Tax=Luteibacter yeojuensis TaxID=345309 RepID=A0A0F3KXZ1_9GAMM|nr:phosphotransferase [Luteibacter yeojuensis]KJV36073.1 aminoglycoside phosphotransferase [Luteibacter yeojuensis]
MIDDAHLAHGLAGDELPPDWPPLAASEVAPVLERVVGAGGFRGMPWRSPRPLSAAALVETTTGVVFVKRHHVAVRSVATLAEEHAYAAHLRAGGVPMPAPYADAAGHTVFTEGDWVYEVHALARGQDIYRDAFSWSPVGGRQHAEAAGAMLARLHLAAEGFDAPQRGTHILVARAEILGARDPVAALEAQLDERPALATYLRARDWHAALHATLAPWHAAMRDAIGEPPRLWTHGDWHVSNLCWSDATDDAAITEVLDAGLCAATFAWFDIATAIERNAIAWLDIARGDIGRGDLACALLAGYHAVRPLGDDDLRAIASLLPLVHVDFALSEVEYFEGVTRRGDHADVAWHTFLHGHAAWFATPHGQAFLATIRHARRGFVVQ